jgi:hypothetical protein
VIDRGLAEAGFRTHRLLSVRLVGGEIPSKGDKGETLQVQVLHRGFAYNGQVFKSLSAVAKAITGSHCNGFWFFALGQHGDQ